MNNDNTPLTILEACTLLARETVSMLEGLDQTGPTCLHGNISGCIYKAASSL